MTADRDRTLTRLHQAAATPGATLDEIDRRVAAELDVDLGQYFAYLEELGRRHFPTRAEARQAIFVWINYYNQQRLHSSCGYRPPVEYEQQLRTTSEPIGSTRAA